MKMLCLLTVITYSKYNKLFFSLLKLETNFSHLRKHATAFFFCISFETVFYPNLYILKQDIAK